MLNKIKVLAKSYLKDPNHWVQNIIWRFPKTVSEEKIIFVLGAPRSGTTLLQNILAGNSKLCSIDAETGMFSMQNIFDMNRRHFRLPTHEINQLLKESKDIVDFFNKGVKRVVENNNAEIFVEKTPQHILHLNFLLKHFPNAKFVHIVRDGRDAFCSAKKTKGFIPQNTINSYAKYWKQCVSIPMQLSTNKSLYTISYEQLSLDPKEEIEKLMSFLDLHFEDNQINPKSFGASSKSDTKEFSKLKSKISTSSVQYNAPHKLNH